MNRYGPVVEKMVVIYGILLAGFVSGLVVLGRRDPGTWSRPLGQVHHAWALELAALLVLSACGYAIRESLFSRVSAVLDMSLALVLIATLVAGPLAGFALALTPDVIRLARRGRHFWNLGLLANVASDAATPLAAGLLLWLVPARDPLELTVTLLVAGLGAAGANYAVARLLLIAMRDGGSPLTAIRTEFLPLLPLELGMIAAAAGVAALMGLFGVGALAVFAALVYVPQAAVGALVRAPSVARMGIDAAAAVYRRALADELGLATRDRRLVAMVDSLVEGRRLGDTPPANSLELMNDAWIVGVCRRRAPTQRAFIASRRAQVVLVAREWAELTARCTPALSHREALAVLREGPLSRDAPQALAAVARIVARESPLTEHVAGVPRLHRLPVPRRVRQAVLPVALARLAA